MLAPARRAGGVVGAFYEFASKRRRSSVRQLKPLSFVTKVW